MGILVRPARERREDVHVGLGLVAFLIMVMMMMMIWLEAFLMVGLVGDNLILF